MEIGGVFVKKEKYLGMAGGGWSSPRGRDMKENGRSANKLGTNISISFLHSM